MNIFRTMKYISNKENISDNKNISDNEYIQDNEICLRQRNIFQITEIF